MAPPLVFLSYAYPDNADGFVEQLQERLAQELQVQTGEPVTVFWDADRIRPGQSWSSQVEDAVKQAKVLIPVMSPSYFRSEACKTEFEAFREKERRTGRNLIFPVYYVDYWEFESAVSDAAGSSIQTLKSRQRLDIRDERFNFPTSFQAKRGITRLAMSICGELARPPSEGTSGSGYVSQHVTKIGDPIYVESLRLKNFRCFDELELRFDHQSRLEGKWTCIAGINGAGKSSILQALGLVLLGDPLAADLLSGRLNRMRRLVNGERQRAEIQAVLRAGEANRAIPLTLDIGDNGIVSTDGPLPTPSSAASACDELRRHVIAGYGATRNLSSRKDNGNEDLSPDVRRQITLFDPLSQLAGAEVLLAQQSDGGPLVPLLQGVLRQVFGAELEIETGPGGIRFTVAHRDLVEAIDLPDGFRATAAWMADLCAIWCEKAPDLAANANPAEIQAIVLIDEIDLHLHPSLQRELVPRLRKALPKVQWIVTTHSPLVLANFDASEIIALDRDREGKVREIDRQILGFTSDEIYEWLMGTRPMGAAIEDELRKSDNGDGKDREETARLLRVSPKQGDEAAAMQVAEFKEILKSLKH